MSLLSYADVRSTNVAKAHDEEYYTYADYSGDGKGVEVITQQIREIFFKCQEENCYVEVAANIYVNL